MKLSAFLFSLMVATSLFAADCSNVAQKIETQCKLEIPYGVQSDLESSSNYCAQTGNLQVVVNPAESTMLVVGLKNCAAAKNSESKQNDVYKLYSLKKATEAKYALGKIFYVTPQGVVEYMNSQREFYEVQTASGKSYKGANGVELRDHKVKILGVNTAPMDSEKLAERSVKIRRRASSVGLKAVGTYVKYERDIEPVRPLPSSRPAPTPNRNTGSDY